MNRTSKIRIISLAGALLDRLRDALMGRALVLRPILVRRPTPERRSFE
jgi:hypothetical protein